MKNSTFFKNWMLLIGMFFLGYSNLFAAQPVESTLLNESFATSLGSFNAVSVAGTQVWNWSSYSGLGYAKVSGYASSVNNENEDWLISPSLDLASLDSAQLSFTQANYFKITSTISNEQTLWISSDYVSGSPTTATWTQLVIPNYQTALSSYTFLNSGIIRIPAAFIGKKVVLAFKYISTTLTSSTWEVHSLIVKGFAPPARVVVFKETFDKMTGSVKAIGSEITTQTAWDLVTDMPGWTGVKAYPSGAKPKMGTSTVAGSITTPAINLSSNSGAFQFSFNAMAWSADTTRLIITVNDIPVQTITGMNADTFYVFKKYGPFEVNTGTATTKIKFYAASAAKSRFFIDSLVVTQLASTDPAVNLGNATFKMESGKTQLGNLTLKGSNLTGDLTISLTNKKGTAFSTNLTIITKVDALAGTSIPVTYAPLAAGLDTALLTISGGGLATAVTISIAGSAYTPIVANLAALRAAYVANPDQSVVYTVTGPIVASFINTTVTSSTSRSVYFQDATGGVLSYESKAALASIITPEYAVGDAVTGFTGTLMEYGKLLEFVPTVAPVASTTGNALIPVELTISQAKSMKEKYESMMVCVKGLSKSLSNVATVWAVGKANYNFGIGTDSIVLRTNYTLMDYMDGTTAIAAGPTNYAGLLIEYNGAVQIVPRSKTDLGYTGPTTNLSQTNIVAAIYGSNGTLHVKALQGQAIEVYNIMGRKVLGTIASDGDNVFQLNKNQILLVKVGKATAKIVL